MGAQRCRARRAQLAAAYKPQEWTSRIRRIFRVARGGIVGAARTGSGGVVAAHQPNAGRAAHRATRSHHLRLAGLGTVKLLPPDQLVYLGGVGALVALGLLERPVATLCGSPTNNDAHAHLKVTGPAHRN